MLDGRVAAACFRVWLTFKWPENFAHEPLVELSIGAVWRFERCGLARVQYNGQTTTG